MGTYSFRELVQMLKKMGFDEYAKKKGTVWVGISPINGEPAQVVIHSDAEGRDIPDGTFQTYYKKLGFRSKAEFDRWKNENL